MTQRGRSKWNFGRATAAALCLLASQQSSGSAELSDIVQLVKIKGWRADLGRICQELFLRPHGQECIFKQISVQEVQGRGDPRGFNVPDGADEAPYVLVFHLSPLVGEFFIASPQGELLKSFVRTKGRGYEPIPNDAIREEFVADLTYWKDNFERIRAGLEGQSGRQR